MVIHKKYKNKKNKEIDPDEIFLDAENLPAFDTDQCEGRLDKPISRWSLAAVGIFFIFIALIFISRLSILQIVHGQSYLNLSQDNSLRTTPIFASRGVLYDRNGVELAWNAPPPPTTSTSTSLAATTATGATATATTSLTFSATSSALTDLNVDQSGEIVPDRDYADIPGIAHTVGYVQYPSKDSNGFYYQEDFKGLAGAEQFFDSQLQGTNGSKIVEVDAHGNVQSQNVVQPATEGQSVTLSVDSRVDKALYDGIEDVANRTGFTGGAGIIMDVHTGEVIADVSYPEYDPTVMSDKTDTALIQSYFTNPEKPFLDRVTEGLYTPGSIVKPYMALAALNEGTIDPNKVIDGQAYLSIPDPYDPTKFSLFHDWQAQGPENMERAIEMSSDYYFYIVGGGYKDQQGLGIARIDKYMNLFGFGQAISSTTDPFFTGVAGTVPSPAWKAANFKGEGWYLGDTYHTSIGQYGWQVSPVQMVRAVASIANGGTLIDPTIIKGGQGDIFGNVNIPEADFDIVRQGMQLGAHEGVAKVLNLPFVNIAAKSGTAELGLARTQVNSWITGFWPYEDPKYAFAVTLENGSVHETIGAAAAMVEALKEINVTAPEYFK
jgi:penicillin-binding protein 2